MHLAPCRRLTNNQLLFKPAPGWVTSGSPLCPPLSTFTLVLHAAAFFFHLRLKHSKPQEGSSCCARRPALCWGRLWGSIQTRAPKQHRSLVPIFGHGLAAGCALPWAQGALPLLPLLGCGSVTQGEFPPSKRGYLVHFSWRGSEEQLLSHSERKCGCVHVSGVISCL